MVSGKRVVRVAHGYGNTLHAVERALAADNDMIETDVWYRGGEVYVRHERRLGPFPLLGDRLMAGHVVGPLSIRIGKRYFVRPDVGRLRLHDLLDAVGGRRRLLLDVKGTYAAGEAGAFAQALAAQIREREAVEMVAFCGQTYSILHRLREITPEIEVRYSIERRHQWQTFLRLVDGDALVRRICIEHRFIDGDRARYVKERGIDLYCWTVDDPAEARRLADQGADGIISNNLTLLASL